MALEQSKSSERVGTFGRAGRIARVDRMAGPGKLATLKRNTLTANAVDGPREGALLTTEDVARITHLSVETLAQWRSQRKGIPFIKISRNCVRYRQSDLDDWLEERIVRTAQDPLQSRRRN